MQMMWWGSGGERFWAGPAVLGVILILLGLLLYANPDLLAYIVAGVFVIAGIGLLTTAWQMRQRTTYRRMDEHGPGRPPWDEPR